MIRLLRSSRSLILGLVIASVGTAACGGGGGGDGIVAPPSGGGGGGGGGGGSGAVAVNSVVLNAPSAAIQVGQTVTFTATPKDASGNALVGRTITWTTSDGNIAAVSSTGTVTGQGPGTAVITATSETKTAQASVTVTSVPIVPVASVGLSSASSLSLLVGVVDSTALGSVTVVATPKDASGNPLSGRTVSWSSDANSIATVSSAGVIKAVGAGTAMITATSEGKTATVPVTVTRPAVAQVTVTPPSTSVKVGASVNVVVALLDAQGHGLTGRIIGLDYDPAIVAVNGEQITGKTQGSAVVTYISEGMRGSVTVTIVP